MSEKISRRSAIKALGVAGVALAAVPYLAKASAFEQMSGQQKNVAVAKPSQHSSTEPLVLFVKGDKVVGYRGLDEIPVHDASLAGMLNSRFDGASS